MTDQPRKTLSIKPKALPSTEQTSKPDQATKTVSRGNKRIIKREQVQPYALAKPKAKAPPKKPNKPRKPVPKKPLIAPSDVRVDNLNAALNAFAVWRERQPLARGIERQIFQLIADQHLSASKRVVQKLLFKHTHQRDYLLKVGQGGQRFNLDGSTDGMILPEERELAGRWLAT
ncbi:ProQ/FINO family protein [uncultured Thiothrix sp.]|uniref:ProQ/FINO family protein n=1 Tax=uncultured Thiothrix sp. TaxID=223185 RepID=UPI002613D511|nr:ProQ/FINO family protein [uncultured Thiothrix sp.]HMT95014.1 ProQ/FINO family protein [Thiolinea sp.]